MIDRKETALNLTLLAIVLALLATCLGGCTHRPTFEPQLRPRRLPHDAGEPHAIEAGHPDIRQARAYLDCCSSTYVEDHHGEGVFDRFGEACE